MYKGLISAAKFVAMSTQQLVAAANSLAEGKLNDAALIAAAKGIILLFIILMQDVCGRNASKTTNTHCVYAI